MVAVGSAGQDESSLLLLQLYVSTKYYGMEDPAPPHTTADYYIQCANTGSSYLDTTDLHCETATEGE